MIRVGVIGFGFWGPNIARNFYSLPGCRLVAVCDRDPHALQRAKETYPGVEVTSDAGDVLTSTEIDAVAIITPVWTHHKLAKEALENGKHVFVEKPFTHKPEQAEELIELADRKNLTVMVDHTFLFTGAVKKIRELIDQGVLGTLYYYDSMRVNLGLFQHDVSVLWDLAPHDLSIMDHLLQKQPESLVATGEKHLNGHADVAFLTVYFPDRVIAHINVSWLSPVKVRTTLIGGEKKMLVWNDLAADEKIKVYDKGVHMNVEPDPVRPPVNYRNGDMWAPKIEHNEALDNELRYFVNCIVDNIKPHNDGRAGLRVVQLLAAAEQSLQNKGKRIELLEYVR